MPTKNYSFRNYFVFIVLPVFLIAFTNCNSSVRQNSGSRNTVKTQNADRNVSVQPDKNGNSFQKVTGPMIEIKENSPADTVRVFYRRLHERKFRDALLLTNLRPAVEGLTEAELDDLGVDFSFLARSIPAEMPINGEIVLGDEATVTVQMPNEKDGKMEVNEIKLRKDGENWVLLVADEQGEKEVEKLGNKYFFDLRMQVHHAEAKAMLDRIKKAEMVYSLQNGGRFADLQTLVKKGFVPRDALGSLTTGYKYEVALAEDQGTYTALAAPEEYGRTGKFSFALKISREKEPELIVKDTNGKYLRN